MLDRVRAFEYERPRFTRGIGCESEDLRLAGLVLVRATSEGPLAWAGPALRGLARASCSRVEDGGTVS